MNVGTRTPHPIRTHDHRCRCRNIPKEPANHGSLEAEQFAHFMSDRLSPSGIRKTNLDRARSIVLTLPEYGEQGRVEDNELILCFNRILERLDEHFGATVITDASEAFAA